MDTATRLLELLGLFHSRPFWTCEELAGRLGVTARTIRRDIARLRALDHPIEATRGRHGGYQLVAGRQLPPLILDDREALAVVVGLRLATTGGVDGLEDAAVVALTKLVRVLPERLRDRLLDLQVATVAIGGGGPVVPTDPDRLVVLAQACRRRERVRFPYRSRDGQRSFRHVEPLKLVHHHGRWYLVAYDLDRGDWRTFRVDRAASPAPTGSWCLPRQEPDAIEFVRNSTDVAAHPLRALVELTVDHDEAVRLGLAQWGTLTEHGDRTMLEVGGSDATTVARWLGVLPCAFRVLGPPEVREALRDHAARLLEA